MRMSIRVEVCKRMYKMSRSQRRNCVLLLMTHDNCSGNNCRVRNNSHSYLIF